MISAIDNGILTTDLDANNLRILNLGHIEPPPHDIVTTDDPRLSDAREPLEGSVTDASVADGAAIDQAKLNFNGDIPTSWIGSNANQAAQGDLAEYTINKGQPGGYVPLDGSAQIDPIYLPDDVGTGTITSVGLVMPADFIVTNSPVTTADVITVTWAHVADGTWFGNSTGGSASPTFNTGPITSTMVPQLDASKIVTGTIDVARLPAAVGVGPTASSGVVPDPGPVGNATDYLARDMTYKPVPTIGPSYQPTADSPVLFPLSVGSDVIVSITCPLFGASLFYRISPVTDYAPVPSSMTVHVLSGQTLDVYAAKAGYNNSDIASYTN